MIRRTVKAIQDLDRFERTGDRLVDVAIHDWDGVPGTP
jgi:hypothetical protein